MKFGYLEELRMRLPLADHSDSVRSISRVSRETRLLLMTILVSLAALWVLAWFRFQERPVTPDPVPPVLAQLRPQSTFDDLARLVSELRPLVGASIVNLDGRTPALRVDQDAAVVMSLHTPQAVLGRDRASGLAVVQTPSADVPILTLWSPRLMDYPRYFIVADVAGESVSLRPVFAGAIYPASSPLWEEEIWALPPATDIPPGRFVFTTDGALAGMAIAHNGGAAIVPAGLVLSSAARLRQQEQAPPGQLGIVIQPMSPSIAAASGARAGVVVTAIDPHGPADGQLFPTNVIEAIDQQAIATPEHWRARIARMNAGEVVSLRVRSGNETRDVQLTAAAPIEHVETVSLGLRLRTVSRVGAEVLEVQPQSAAAHAGIQQGDIITVAGTWQSPTAAQLSRAFADVPQGGSLLVAITGSDMPRVAVLEK
jgi:hypothetical protein